MKHIVGLFLAITLIFTLSACKRTEKTELTAEQITEPAETNDTNLEVGEPVDMKNELRLKIDDTVVPVKWENNASVAELKEYALSDEISISMSMYGGWEQVGSLGRSITRDDTRQPAQNGDIMLYNGNQMVIFYGSNLWSYTKLGHIDLNEQEVTELLSSGDVTATLYVD